MTAILSQLTSIVSQVTSEAFKSKFRLGPHRGLAERLTSPLMGKCFGTPENHPLRWGGVAGSGPPTVPRAQAPGKGMVRVFNFC